MKKMPKFRAWFENKKVMSEVKKINFWSEELDTVAFEGKSLEDVELMQATGLFDKNGTEIFEGDIITKDEGETFGIVRYGICQSSLCFYVEGNYKGSELTYPINPNFPRFYKVVGNIYEQPELLRKIKGE